MSNVKRSLKELINARQNKRILRMSFPDNDGPKAMLLPDSLHASEELSRDFTFTVELLAEDARIPLKDMLGKMVSIELVRVDGSLRYFNGHVFEFRLVKTDGGLAFYQMVLKPWLAYLALRKNNRLFQHQSLHAKCDTIFQEHGVYREWNCRLNDEDPEVTMTCQFDESDHNFLHRHWERIGWHYWYEFDAKGHKLMLSDNSTVAIPIDGEIGVWFQREGGSQEEDGIGDWSPVRRAAASKVALSSFDFKNPQPQHARASTLNKQGAVRTVESYEYTGALGFKSWAGGDKLSALRMKEIDAVAKWYEGGGNNGRIQPGRSFRLEGYFDRGASIEAREFLVLSVVHEASNNYLQNGQPAHYSNSFTCTRKSVSWRPGRGHNSEDTRIYGIQTATVVGPSGENHHVDEYGRVKVQFNWDRLGKNNNHSSA